MPAVPVSPAVPAPAVFVNYRSQKGMSTAIIVERFLSDRFGSENVFRAAKSIGAGARFPDELLNAVRDAAVLVAVIDPQWEYALSATGSRALEDPDDWPRREILEALHHGTLVVPLLAERNERLCREALPPELEGLADLQSRHVYNRTVDADLTRLADELAVRVPQLAAADTAGAARSEEREPGGGRFRARDLRQQGVSGIGFVNGAFNGSYINKPTGPVNTGPGNQNTTYHAAAGGGEAPLVLTGQDSLPADGDPDTE